MVGSDAANVDVLNAYHEVQQSENDFPHRVRALIQYRHLVAKHAHLSAAVAPAIVQRPVLFAEDRDTSTSTYVDDFRVSTICERALLSLAQTGGSSLRDLLLLFGFEPASAGEAADILRRELREFSAGIYNS
ncbi:unnamed protein product, partial [Amoebophrya sp. A25]|eukprot:GSA25T00009460001.1